MGFSAISYEYLFIYNISGKIEQNNSVVFFLHNLQLNCGTFSCYRFISFLKSHQGDITYMQSLLSQSV